MGKRILVTSTDLMMVQFLLPHIMNLSENGYEVEIACSDVGNRMDEIRQKLNDYVKAIHTVRLHRSPADPDNLNGYKDMKKAINNDHYDIIWTNEPVMGVVTRLAARKARKAGTKVLYMTHGFHFYSGAPVLNWMIYYPIERLMAHCTDVLATVNKEDYNRAKSFSVKAVRHIHGIGVDTSRLTLCERRNNIRVELGLTKDDLLVLSVGELNVNKNQKVIIQAIASLHDDNIHYILCGKGDQLEKLQKLAIECNLYKNVHFLGYRTDVVDICSQVDIFAFPTYREGLGLAALEAMYAGLPLITSDVRGPSDFMENGKTGYTASPGDIKSFAKAIKKLKNNKMLREKMGDYNKNAVLPYCLEAVKTEVLNLLQTI